MERKKANTRFLCVTITEKHGSGKNDKRPTLHETGKIRRFVSDFYYFVSENSSSRTRRKVLAAVVNTWYFFQTRNSFTWGSPTMGR